MGPFREDEGLWRDVYFERQMKAVNRPMEERRVNADTKAIFGSRSQPSQRISVRRYDDTPCKQRTHEGDQRALSRQGSNGIQGWLVISFKDATLLRRRVEYTPESGDPCHSDIVLPDDAVAKDGWEDAKVHLQNILSLSRWEDRCGPIPT